MDVDKNEDEDGSNHGSEHSDKDEEDEEKEDEDEVEEKEEEEEEEDDEDEVENNNEDDGYSSEKEMKKLEELEKELKPLIELKSVHETDVLPLIKEICAHWNYNLQKISEKVQSWFNVHAQLLLHDIVWQIAREDSRHTERETQKTQLKQKKYQEIEKLKQFQNEYQTNKKFQITLTKPIENYMDFDKIKKFEDGIEKLKKEGKYSKENEVYLLIKEEELNKIDGYCCQTKEDKEEMKRCFTPQVTYLKLNKQKRVISNNDGNDNYFIYEMDCKDFYHHNIKEFALYYGTAHYSPFDDYDYDEQEKKKKKILVPQNHLKKHINVHLRYYPANH